MRRHIAPSLACVLLSAAAARTEPQPIAAPAAAPFEFRDGDRVAMIGDALIEREGEFGFIETAIVARYPDRAIAFRNLGWSGDTPAGAARAAIDPPRGGWDRLQDDIRAVKPTVAIVGYGMASSFDGEAGLAKFEAEMNALLDALPALAGGPVRVILLGPIRYERRDADAIDPVRHNEALAKYGGAIRAIAAKRGAAFVWLSELGDGGSRGPKAPPTRLTDDGIHLNADGYRAAADAVSRQLLGQTAGAGPGAARFEALRQAVIAKNRLFFDRRRPQNAIYLFGARQHEQGQHVRELPLFDPLVAAEEASITSILKGQGTGRAASVPKTPPPPPAQALPPNPAPSIPLQVADGFEIHLFAATPQIPKPIHMNFDPQGRLWVVTSSVYPHIEPGQQADDKIVILEDTDRDGRADKVTVFADGLRIPTGVLPGDGGCYVGHGTQLIHLADTDGDGRADRTRIVLSGFGTEDTHHMIHTLRWGPDGCLYFNQSIYINSSIETPHGVVRLARGGIFRLRPDTLQLDVFVKGLNNAWSHCIDAFGQSFAGDASGDNTVWHCVPGATYWDYAGGRRFLPGIGPAQNPKTCGMEIVSGRHLPDDWQGNIVAGDFKTNRVRRFVLRENGSTFTAEEKPNLVRSKNASFRPVDVKMGPDGAIYVADWSNPIINHGEVDFRDPRRDKKTGRIWRITAKGRALTRTPDLIKMLDADLLDQLKSPEGYTREQARRVLAKRGPKILPALVPWAGAQKDDRARLEALWLYFAAGRGTPPYNAASEMELLGRLLCSSDARVRAAAVRVLSNVTGLKHEETPDDPIAALAEMAARAITWDARRMDSGDAIDSLVVPIADDHPRVRLEAVRALGLIPTARAAALALSVLDQPMDPTLDYALRTTIEELAEPWVAALESGAGRIYTDTPHFSFVLGALPPEAAARVLRMASHEQSIPRDASGPMLDILAKAGGPAELRELLDRLLAGGFDTAGQAKVVAALDEAARLRGVRPAGNLEGVGALLDVGGVSGPRPPEDRDPKVAPIPARAELLRLLGRWKLGSQVPRLLAFAGDDAAPPSVRQAAFEGLREIGGPAVGDGVRPLCGKERPWPIRDQAVRVLMALDAASAAPTAIEVLAAAPDEESALHLWRALLGVRGAAGAITRAIPGSRFPPHVAKTGRRAAREMWEDPGAAQHLPELALALSTGANLAGQGRELTSEEIRNFASKAAHDGDAARGERVFRRKDLRCLDCHAVAGAGGKAGPDLGAVGAAAPVDYLVESILYPSRKIKEGFHAALVQTADERVFIGRPVRETDQELTLLTSENREVSIPKKDVAERKAVPQSIMPSGLADALPPGDVLDLVRFLSELGRPGAYDTTKLKAARVWRAGPAPDARTVAYALVDGRLPAAELPPGTAFAATRFRTAAGARVTLAVTAPGARAAIDGKPIAGEGPASVELYPGTHELTVTADPARWPEFVRVESDDVTFLTEP